MALVSFVVQSSCSCELDTAIRGHTSCCAGPPLWAGSCSLVAQSSCYCELDTTIRGYSRYTSCCAGCPLWSWFCSCRSICSDTATRCHTSYWTGSHSTLSYLVCDASSGSTMLVLATRCHLIKINLVLFPVTVLRSLGFLIPSFTKKTVPSNPVVHLPLTCA